MKLFYSPFSPFVRKVLVVAEERGVALERVAAQVSPVERNRELGAHNPAAKLPTLLLDDGIALFDSRVICEYLDALPGAGPRFFPPPPTRWRALTLQALGDGIAEAAVLTRYETALRPEPQRWASWVSGQRQKMDGALDALESGWLEHLGGAIDIGAVACGCALGYLDLRFPDHGWRATRPGLTAWAAHFCARPSMRATAPPSP